MLEKARQVARRIPAAQFLYGRLRGAFRRGPAEVATVEAIFTEKARSNAWRGKESVSGLGSDLVQTRVIAAELPLLFRDLQAQTFLDIPCGDFNWMRTVDLTGVHYIGGDIVPELVERNQRFASDRVEFRHLDLLRDPVPRADIVLCRDCLVHLSFADGLRALRNIRASGSTWLLTTTFPGRGDNAEIPTGRWRPLNLEREPFALPPPERLVVEQCTQGGGKYADKALGLWPVASLPI